MSNLLGYMQGIPLVTKAAAAVYSVVSVSAMLLRFRAATDPATEDLIHLASLDPVRFLILRPGFIISYPWTLATSVLVETNPLLFLVDLVSFVIIGSFLERQWGPRSYALLLLVVSTISALASVLAVIVIYAIRSNSVLLYSTQINGLAAVFSGFAIGLKQLIPDYNIKLFRGTLSFRMNDVPGLYTLLTPLMFVLLGNLGGILLVNTGFFVSFIYLRFYKRDGSIYGDRSEAFAFATLFPEFIQPVIRKLSTGIYNLAVACKIITSDEGYQRAVIDSESEGGSRPAEQAAAAEESDADRRRALAAKALEDRLNSTASAQNNASSSSAAAAVASNGSK
ncbi:hypothetical protein GGI12_002749 [Dipsacomyces acuminosporus]|nr:hypothetical protein GGI12_002749 [Dipsacomyces acuminosporus]